jgi:hypothetical protein
VAKRKAETYTPKSQIGFVPMGKMAVSEQAQRSLDKNRVEHLLANFDPELLGSLHVSQRDGRYFIIDGQHRFDTVKQWMGDGWEVQQLRCHIYTNLNEAQEADMFLRLNDAKPVGSFDKFEKAVVAGREREMAINKIVHDCGFKIARTRKNYEGAIGSVSALGRVFDKYGPLPLANSLIVAHAAFGEPGLEGYIVEALGMIWHRYGKLLNKDELSSAISEVRGGLKTFVNRTNVARQKYGRSRPVCFAAVVVDAYNSSLGPRSAKRLASWWQSA